MGETSEGERAEAPKETPSFDPVAQLAIANNQLKWFSALWLVVFSTFIARNYFLGLPGEVGFSIGGFKLNTFGILVGCAVFYGGIWVKRVCLINGADWEQLYGILVKISVSGFIVSHVFEVVAYHPDDMWPRILNPRRGMSSFGGFLGGAVSLYYLLYKYKLNMRKYYDWVVYGFTGGWLFGRLACFSVHDHPGKVTDFFMGIEGIDGTRAIRHELGLYELLFALVLFITLTLLIRRPRPPGFVVAIVGLTYPCIRFFLDSLRIRDAQYGGLTPGQMMCIPLFLLGGFYLWRVLSYGRKHPEENWVGA